MNINIQQILGFTIRTTDGEYGTVSDVLFSHDDHVIRYLVVDPQRWNPLSHKVLISPISVYYINIDAQEVCLSIDIEKIKAAPGIEEYETVSRHFESELYRYYGYGYYWMGADLWGMSSDPALLRPQNVSEQSTPDILEKDIPLRSINEVCGYLVKTDDDKHQQMADYIFDTKSWKIKFAAVDAQNGMIATERCLIKVSAIKEYNWHQQLVTLYISSHQLLGNPHFESELLNSEPFLSMMELSATKNPS